jgi:small subunit ribosomal protein S18
MAKPVRTKNKDNARRAKKKISLLITDRVEYVDWKDVNLLRRFMSDRAKIRARRVSGNSAQQQAEIAKAIKNAREMALLPYASRVTQTRGPKRDGERGGRRERDRDLPAPDITPLSASVDVDGDVDVDDTYGEGFDDVVEGGGTEGADELVGAETGGSAANEDES